jgi:hypothetical protein
MEEIFQGYRLCEDTCKRYKGRDGLMQGVRPSHKRRRRRAILVPNGLADVEYAAAHNALGTAAAVGAITVRLVVEAHLVERKGAPPLALSPESDLLLRHAILVAIKLVVTAKKQWRRGVRVGG